MNRLKFVILMLMFACSMEVKATCDFVLKESGEDYEMVKMPAWAEKTKENKKAILPQNLVGQALGFNKMSANGMPDGTWEVCRYPNTLLTKYGVKDGLFDGVYENYDLKTGAFMKGTYKKGLRVGSWQFRNENGSVENTTFKDGLPAEMMKNDEDRKAMAFMKMFTSEMDGSMLNQAIEDMAEEQDVDYELDDMSEEAEQGLGAEMAFWHLGFEKFNESLDEAMEEIDQEMGK